MKVGDHVITNKDQILPAYQNRKAVIVHINTKEKDLQVILKLLDTGEIVKCSTSQIKYQGLPEEPSLFKLFWRAKFRATITWFQDLFLGGSANFQKVEKMTGWKPPAAVESKHPTDS